MDGKTKVERELIVYSQLTDAEYGTLVCLLRLTGNDDFAGHKLWCDKLHFFPLRSPGLERATNWLGAHGFSYEVIITKTITSSIGINDRKHGGQNDLTKR